MMVELDLEQLKAVESKSDRVLVLAGAGSGKTRTLIERIAYLIETQKVSPYEIMAFTFTRKAAQEIKARLVNRIGHQAYKITMGTMHAIALQMAQRFAEKIGLKKNLTVYSEWESEFLLKEVAKEIGLYGKTWKIQRKEIEQALFSYYHHKIIPDGKAGQLSSIFLQRCKENNACTYEELLIKLEELISVLAKYLQIKNILIDEVQDINAMQWRIIEKMCRHFKANIFCVGDIDQAIYQFRGAIPKYLIENQSSFDIYRLEVNYRSCTSVVEAANKLIKNNSNRIDKDIVPDSKELGKCVVLTNQNTENICEEVKKIFGSVIPHQESKSLQMAILSRNHYLLQKLSKRLNEAGVVHNYAGRKTKLTQSEEFIRFNSFLKLCVNQYDNFSFLLIKDMIGLSNEQYNDIRLKAVQDGRSHFQIWHISNNNKFTQFYNSIENRDIFSIAEILEFLLSVQPLALIDFKATLDFILSWVENNPEGKLQDYLSWLATYNIQDEITKESDLLTLTTIHGSKGLEWNTVIVIGCNEGILPSKQAIASGDIEEERRLMYVAITRARDKLILSVRPEQRETFGQIYENSISRFIEESY
ncbi:MAG: ATP-dependent helicase [Desulfobacterales bacterium]|nr:ATP-dependent helicase [Desulfobacterales bacterium]